MPNRGLIVMVALMVAMFIVAGGATALGDNQAPIIDGQPAVTTTNATTTTSEDPAQAQVPPAVTVPTTTASAPAFGMGQPLQIFQAQAIRQAVKQALQFRKNAWHWQELMGMRRTPSNFKTANIHSPAYSRWVRDLWQHRAGKLHIRANRWMAARIQFYRSQVRSMSRVMGIRVPAPQRVLASGGIMSQFLQLRHRVQKVGWQYRHPPHLSQFMCIHSHEGSWTDSGSPYWGGIQFGYGEWRRFGMPYTGKPYANEASPLEQIWAGERYWRLSGFNPWPQTARMCGLI